MLPRVEVDASLDALFAGTLTTKYDRRDGHMIGGDQALCSLDMYEWNSLALATLDFRHIDPEAIRPTWGEMFTTQTSIATQLEVYSSTVRFTYRGMRVKLSTEDLKRSLAEHKIKCRAMGIEKTKLSGEYKKLRTLSQSPEPHIPFVDIDGKAALLLAFGESHNSVIRLEGPSAVIQLFAGFQELYAIGLENNELYYAQVSEFPKAMTENKLVLERHPNFAGMRIQHVSTLENTAILTNHGHVFLVGPKYAKLPCPPMVRWDIQDDVVLSVEISFHYVILITLKGHLYKLKLDDYKQHPKLLYASEEHKIKTVKYCGEWILLAITVGHQVLIWTENPDDKPTIVCLFPESPLAQLTKPTPIVLPWKVEDAAFFNKQLFVSSRRVYNYNAVFASFLNRSALTELDPFIYWDRSALSSYHDEMSNQKANERLRDLAFGAGGAVGGSQGGYSSYQMSKLRAYGSNNYGTSLYLGDSTTSLQLRTLQQSSPKLIQDLIASSSNSPGGYLLQTPPTSTPSPAASMAISAYGEGDANDIQYTAISDEAQGATLSGIHGPEMFGFNSRLTALYEMSDATEYERNLKHMAFVKLNDEFMARAMVVVKTIVEEMHLPDEQKTFATLRSAGGLAGGEKYLIDGNIFVKLCIDNNSLYGGNEWSGKVANLEIHGMDAYASCLPHLPKGSKLRVPLMSMIDYLGYRALVSTMCPINKLTIVYGSNDAGQTVHNDDEEAEELMFQCAQMLNLAPHVVKNCNTLISSAADVEVHRGQDGFLYLLDTARVFPPVQPGVVKSVPLGAYTVDDQIHAKDLSREQTQSLLKGLDSVPISEGLLYFKLPKEPEPFPSIDPSLILDPDESLSEGAPDTARQRSTSSNASVSSLPEIEANFVNPTATALLGRIIRGDAWFLRNSIGQSLYHQFRPEYVKAYPTPLSSDAFSAFADDPEGKHNKDVKEASSLMEQHYLVSVKSQFCEATPFLLPSLDTCVKQNALGTHTGHLMSAIYSPQTLVKFLHRVGLNIRSLGNIRVHAPLSHIRNLAMIEMVSRACVSYVKRRLRSAQALHTACRQSMGQATHDSSNSQLDDWDFLPSVDVSSFSDKPLEYFLKAILVQAFNSIFAHSASSDFFWTQVLKIHLLVKFGADCLLEAETYRKYSLQLETPMSYLFQTISHRCGVIWDHETATKMQAASWSTTPISLSADQIVGFALSSKSTKMASLQHLKQNMYDGIFKDTITEQQKYGLPAFHPPSYSDPTSSKVRNLVYHPVYSGSYENPKKAKDPLMQPATDGASQKSDVSFPQGSSSTLPLPEEDGLMQFHNKSIEFYSKWSDMLEKAGKSVSVVDRVKLMISRVRPILDNRCPGGASELDGVESEWRAMCDLLKDVPMVNCEVLAQIFYIRGQILHLRNDYFGAEQYYMCALNTLAMPMYNSHIVGIQTMHMIYGGKIRPEDAYVKANRRCSMHPFAMLIIDKILTLQIEMNGSIMSQFYVWTLFRYIWSTWPCLGSMVAKRRIFNGHSIPLAMVHPHRWRYVRSFNTTIGKFDTKIEEQAFHSFLSQGIYELDHPIIQKWLADVYDLEPNIGFDVSTHWLDSDLRTFPRLFIPLMAASTFAPITHQPVFRPTGPLNAFMTSALAQLLPVNFAWMWWRVLPPYPQHTNFMMTTRLGRYEATICYNPIRRRIGRSDQSDKSPSRITDCDALLFNRYLIHETGSSTDPHKQLQSMRQQLAAVSKQLDEPFEPYKHYPPETLERFMHGSVLILRVPLFHNATDLRTNENPDFYNPDRTESTVSTIQYWNPKFPMPRHFMVHMTISPEGYQVIGMPEWFDNVGAIQLDRYVCQRKTEPSAEFTVITEKGTLILAKDLNGVGGSDNHPRMTTEEDYNQVKLLDFAGESPLWLRFNRSPPLEYFANADEQEMRQLKTLSVCVTRSGHIYIWGSNEHGLFGNGRDNEWSDSPKLVSSLMSNKIIDVDVGVGSIITLSDDGAIHFWGSILPAEATHFITQYQLETEKRIHQPTFLPCLKELPLWGGVVEQKCSAISSGCHFVVAVSNYGIPYFYGLQSQYMPLSPDWKRVYCPERITAVSSGTWHTILLGESGRVYGFGLNENGQCGFPVPSEIDGFTRCLAPIPLEAYTMHSSKPVKVVQIQASFSRSIALDSDGQVWIWGTARQSVPHRIRLPSPAAWLSFSSQGHFMVLTEFPQIPSRTLPLVSPEEQLEAIRRIVEEVRLSAQPAPKSTVTRAFGKSQYGFTFTLKASIPISQAAISDDTQSSSSTVSEPPIIPQVADPTDSILPAAGTPVKQREPEPQSVPDDSIDAVGSVASSSFLINRSQVLNNMRVASSITPRLPLSREEQVMIDLWGDSGSLLFNTITKMIDMALEPLKEKMESLNDRIKTLEGKPDSKSR